MGSSIETQLRAQVLGLERRLRALERKFPSSQGGLNRSLAAGPGGSGRWRDVLEVPDPLTGSDGDHLERQADGSYSWAATREVPAGGAAGTHLESDGAEGYDWAVTREVPAGGLDGQYLVANGDGTYAWRTGIKIASDYNTTDAFINHDGVTPLILDTNLETVDQFTTHTPGTSEVFIGTDSIVRVTFYLLVQSTAANQEFQTTLRVNGTTLGTWVSSSRLSDTQNAQYSGTVLLPAIISNGDYIEWVTEQTLGASDINILESFFELSLYRTYAVEEGVGLR